MGTELGPYIRMEHLVREAATRYQLDTNVSLRELLDPVKEQIAAYLQFENFDKPEFLDRISGLLAMEARGIGRRAEFLTAAVTAIKDLRARL